MLSCSRCRALRFGLSITITLLLSPVMAFAGSLTLYTDREAFLAAANANRLLTFDDPAVGVFELIPLETPLGTTSFPQVTYEFGDVQVVYGESSYKDVRVILDELLPIPLGVSVRLPQNTYAVGVDVLQAALTTFSISFDGVRWTQNYVPPGCTYPFFDFEPCVPFSGFVGVVAADDSEPIRGFSAFANPPGVLFEPPKALGYPVVLDNLTMRVPEPATALLLGAGLVGVCWRRRTTK